MDVCLFIYVYISLGVGEDRLEGEENNEDNEDGGV